MKLLCLLRSGQGHSSRQSVHLNDLHPRRAARTLSTLRSAADTVASAMLRNHTCAKSVIADTLFNDAADFSLAKDAYGWAPWLMFQCRGAQNSFFHSFSNFACFLANSPGQFPAICAALVSAGALTPLNKVSTEEQQQREDAGLPPKLRPINSNSMLAKVVLKEGILRARRIDLDRKEELRGREWRWFWG